MNKFAFTYLIKQDKKTWNEFVISLNLLYKNLLSHLNCKYKVLIFCEGNPTSNANSLIKFLQIKNINITLKKINLKNYVGRKSSEKYINNFPHVSDCTKSFSLGYRDMCKFFTKDIFDDDLFVDTEYFIRIDSDSFFLNIERNFIINLQKIKADYAYLNGTIQLEDKGVALGFGQCLFQFCKKNNMNKDFLNICQEATLRPHIYYTNFEVIKLKWIHKEINQKLLDHIISNKGIYNYRWGDALIRYYTIKLIGAKILALNGCLYKHSSIYDSRNFLKRIISKIYCKINFKYHGNKYEIKPSRLDKFFLNMD